jgi:hypothetical protein
MTSTPNPASGDDNIEIPSVDKRQYKHLVLGPSKNSSLTHHDHDPNPLRQQQQQHEHLSMDVLLISDPETDKASAAMDIYIGQLCDTIPGIAHFCEHMLFIGTTKYPTENAYDQYLSTHGGSSNAFTYVAKKNEMGNTNTFV